MSRIRTIKPEFPHSESMGRVSRDARLLFVLLWTLCDDEGRTRAASRMLASLLFPYDDDAPRLIDGWLDELEREGCVIRYSIEGSAYLQVAKWLNHQKIDRPSKSKIPPPGEGSRILANPREPSSLDQGSRIKDQGSGSRSEERAGAGADTHAGARDGPADAEDPEPAARTPAGEICFALRRAGIASVQPSHPLLLALIEAGAEPSEFLAAVPDAQSRSNGFAYLLAVVRGRREDAARAAQSLHRGPMPRTETPYERRARERAEAYAPGIAVRAPGADRNIVDLQEAPANVPLIQGH